MGAYRSKPITDKVSNDEMGKYVKCGASSMQGWRATQEDAHNCIIKYDENASLFAVYDGHGGHEVAKYCSDNLPKYLKDCGSYKNGEYAKALEEAFLGFDATLIEPGVVKILEHIVKCDDEVEGGDNQHSGSEDEENISNLYEEAQMPLEEVMAKYQSDGKNPALKKLRGTTTPPSPYLVAKQAGKSKFAEEAGSSKASSSSSSSGSSSSCSSTSSSAEPMEESSNESVEKDEKNGQKEDNKESVSNGNTQQEKISEQGVDSNSSLKSQDSCETNGEKTSKEQEDLKNKSAERSEDDNSCTSNNKSEVSEVGVGEVVKSEKGEYEASTASPKEKVKSASDKVTEKEDHESEGESSGDGVKEEIKQEKDVPKKPEVNGDVEPSDLKESKKEPHENGDVGDEETEEDEEKDNKEVNKSPKGKGKGKAIVKKSDQPKRTSARQRNMAILFHSLLMAHDSADSESDDEGDESFQGADESAPLSLGKRRAPGMLRKGSGHWKAQPPLKWSTSRVPRRRQKRVSPKKSAGKRAYQKPSKVQGLAQIQGTDPAARPIDCRSLSPGQPACDQVAAEQARSTSRHSVRSSNDEEDKEEVEAEGEEEDDEDGDEEGGEEEEDDEDYEGDDEDITQTAKGPGVESGCTAVVALLHGRDLYVANAGDSRCIVSRAGEALDMSLDHKPEDDIEMERIAGAGGYVSSDGRVNGGLNLSRAIGDHAYKQTENLPPEKQMITALPDVRTLSLDPEKDEFMVLACDGIWNSMTSQEVVNFVRSRIQNEDVKLSVICEELFDFCLAPNTASDGTGCDNMTAVIVQFLPVLKEAPSSDLPNTSISTTANKRPASPSEDSDTSAKRFKIGVV